MSLFETFKQRHLVRKVAIKQIFLYFHTPQSDPHRFFFSNFTPRKILKNLKAYPGCMQSVQKKFKSGPDR